MVSVLSYSNNIDSNISRLAPHRGTVAGVVSSERENMLCIYASTWAPCGVDDAIDPGIATGDDVSAWEGNEKLWRV